MLCQMKDMQELKIGGKTWGIRHPVIHADPWSFRHKALISPVGAGMPIWTKRTATVDLKRGASILAL